MDLDDLNKLIKFGKHDTRITHYLNNENCEIASVTCLITIITQLIILPFLQMIYVDRTAEQIRSHRILSIVYIVSASCFYMYFNHYNKYNKDDESQNYLMIALALFDILLIVNGILLSSLFFIDTFAFAALIPSLFWIYSVFVVAPRYSIPTSIFLFLWIYQHGLYFGVVNSQDFTLMIYTWMCLIGSSLMRFISAVSGARSHFQFQEANMQLEKMNRSLHQKTRYDGLTGVLNREALRQDFESYIKQDVTIMFCDIDDFKVFNDEYGHNIGDHVLKDFAHILTRCFSEENVYRYGGDEFLVITNSPLDAFKVKALKARKDLLNQSIEGVYEQVTGSFGFVHGYCDSIDTLREMLVHSDVHLYDAKLTGKNRIVGYVFDQIIEKEEEIDLPLTIEEMECVRAELLERNEFVERCKLLKESDLLMNNKIAITAIQVKGMNEENQEAIVRLILSTFFLSPIMMHDDIFIIYGTYSTIKTKIIHVHETIKRFKKSDITMKAILLLPNVNHSMDDNTAALYQKLEQLEEDQWFAEVLEISENKKSSYE